MAASTSSLPTIVDTDARFRALVAAIEAALTAGGWTKTTESVAMIDSATVAKPTSTSTMMGYSLWQSPVESGLNRIYLKIEFGSTATSSNSPGFYMTAGFGSDGAGNISPVNGPVSDRRLVGLGTATATVRNLYLAAGNGYFSFNWAGPNTSETLAFCVERSREGSAYTQIDELIFYTQSSAGSLWLQTVSKVLGVAFPAENQNYGMILPTSANAIVGSDVGVGLIHSSRGGWTNPMLSLLGVNGTQLGAYGTTVSITHYGAAHTYMIPEPGSSNAFFSGSNPLLTRYE